jgi:sulfatase maturation enzyme AslB (radical SAM superfamily)
LSELLRDSHARRRFTERPVQLMQRDCIDCDYLALCHGGCPVRTYSVRGTLFEKDPYCELYKKLFRHIEDHATRLAGSGAMSPSTSNQGDAAFGS